MSPEEVEAEVERLAADVQEFDDELDRVADLAESLDEPVDDLPGDWI